MPKLVLKAFLLFAVAFFYQRIKLFYLYFNYIVYVFSFASKYNANMSELFELKLSNIELKNFDSKIKLSHGLKWFNV